MFPPGPWKWAGWGGGGAIGFAAALHFFCEEVMESFGDHILFCNKAEFHTRHHIIVECLAAFVAASGLCATNEVQIDGQK